MFFIQASYISVKLFLSSTLLHNICVKFKKILMTNDLESVVEIVMNFDKLAYNLL